MDFDGETCSLASTVSSNATGDNIPGPGRMLGKLYDFAGRKLENGINPLLRKFRKRNRTNNARHGATHRRTHYDDDEYDPDLEYRLEECSLISTISSGATADNLPGHGYTLGLLYTAAGRRLETKLGYWAAKAGKGPHVAAIRIQRRRIKSLQIPYGSKKSVQKYDKIRKDLAKLLRYIQSQTPETQLQALEYVVNLAIDDSFIREELRILKAEHIIEPLQTWNAYKGGFASQLLSSSRKALICLEDTKVNTLAHMTEAWTFEGPDWPYAALASLSDYLKDADRAFLVIRHLKRMLEKLLECQHIYAPELVQSTINFKEFPRDHVEWTYVDRLILRLLDHLLLNRAWQEFNLTPLLTFIMRNADVMPETLGSKHFRWFEAFDNSNPYNGLDKLHIYFTRCLLRGIMLENGLEDASTYQLDLSYLQMLYPHSSVKALLCRISCPPEIVLTNFVARAYGFEDLLFMGKREHRIILDPGYLREACDSLAQSVDSGNALVRKRTVRAFQYIISIDVYCRDAAFRSLKRTHLLQKPPVQIMSLIEDSAKKCVPAERLWGDNNTVVRHCNANGFLLHIHQNKWLWSKGSRIECNEPEGNEQALVFQEKDVLELHIPRGTAFFPAGHHPLFAGITEDGTKSYIGHAVSRIDSYSNYIAIAEGTKPEDLRMTDKQMAKDNVVPMYLVVYVLRYPPTAYTRCERQMGYLCEEDIGHDATGPYSWRPWDPDEMMRL